MSLRVFTDQLVKSSSINFPPKRIISLVPSQTELLFDLGLNEEVIGITKFCIYPKAKVKAKVKVGGTKTLNIDLIRSLKPDLIIGNKEENEQSQIETLMREYPVWMSDVSNLESALNMIKGIGELVDRKNNAIALAQQISLKFETLNKSNKAAKVLYLIWQKPYMAAGANTFIDAMLQQCGFQSVLVSERYPEVTIEDLRKAEVIMLSSEPYPFKQKHADIIGALCPDGKVILVDGEMFSWYGSRMLKAGDYFKQLIDGLNN